MNKYETIVVRARALIVDDGQILLARHYKNPQKKYSFLPSGKVEFGEYAEDALKRELLEELNSDIKIKRFLGTGQGIWNEDKGMQHDICLYFDVSSQKLSSKITPPPCLENGIEKKFYVEFFWCPISKIKEANLMAPYVQNAIRDWLKGKTSTTVLSD